MQNLSSQSIKELKAILVKEAGNSILELNDEEINELGLLFLEVYAFGLKRRVNKK